MSAASASAGAQVVAVTYHPGAALATFLDSLALASREQPEVVLADNGGADPDVTRAAQRAGVTLLSMPSNLGYGGAANRGAQLSDSEWLLVANPDVVFDPGSLDTLLDATARHPDGAAFGPAIVTPEGDLYPSARAFPSLRRGIGHAVFGWWWPGNPWTRAYRNESGSPVEGPAGWLSGSCLLLRRSAFEAVGGFDESYFMYFEDLDLCRRLSEAGWSNVHVPSTRVLHTGGHATQRDRATAAKMLAAHHASAYRYLSRQYPGPAYAPLRVVLRVALAARALLGRLAPSVGAGARPTRSSDILGG